jgi:LacI family transcriptional regulator
MPQPATLQDVADKAGVHRSTVSLALRNNPRISREVRHRVQAVALQLGYRSNPLVTALMRSRRSGRSAKQVVLAYVTNYPTRYGWRPPHHDRPDFYPGAAQRAEELGYKLEHFWLAEPGMTPSRFCDILLNRGINGMLIGRLPPGESELNLQWEHFSAVALGLTLRSPRLHHVAEDAYAAAWDAMERCIEGGYERIGFVFSHANDSPDFGARMLGGYLCQQLRLKPENRLPYCEFQPDPHFKKHFLEWFDRCRPDALLATDADAVLRFFPDRRLPRGCRLISLTKLHQGLCGIYHDPARLGALAVDLVVGMLHRGETGISAEPHYVLIPGDWVDENHAPQNLTKTRPALPL